MIFTSGRQSGDLGHSRCHRTAGSMYLKPTDPPLMAMVEVNWESSWGGASAVSGGIRSEASASVSLSSAQKLAPAPMQHQF